MENYEQKYNEALKRARKLYDSSEYVCEMDSYATIFPELRESEDDESKKWILEYLYDGLRKSDEQFKGQFKAAIARLEKQGKNKDQNNKIYIQKFNIGDTVCRQGYEDHTIEKIYNDGKFEPVYICKNEEGLESHISFSEQDEWKPKYRVQPQPKHEWSEEDEGMLLMCSDAIAAACAATYYTTEEMNKMQNWLKSLKPNHWKPSEEQLKALWKVIPSNPNSEKDIDTIRTFCTLRRIKKTLTMTDKELIKQEIERKQKDIAGAYESEDTEHGYKQCCKEILSFIDSIPEEPANEDLEEELTKYIESKFTIDKEQLDRFGIKPEDYTFSLDKKDMLNFARHFAEWQREKGIKAVKSCKELYAAIKENQEKKIFNDDFEKASYAQGMIDGSMWQKQKDQETIELAEEHAMFAGMEKMREEMLKDAVLETKVMIDCDGDGIETPYEEWLTLEDTEIPCVPDGFKDGDIVKVILVKEDLP